MTFYLNLCLAIFLLHVAYMAYAVIWPEKAEFYHESELGYWTQAVLLSMPFVNIISFLVVLYFWATMPAHLWNENSDDRNQH